MSGLSTSIPADTIRAASLGDQDALVRLLAAAQPDIRRFARRSCRRSSDIDDAVQEALWILARRIGTLRAIGSLSSWLLAIVRRECLRLARRAWSGLSGEEKIEEMVVQRPDAELRLDLAAGLQSLPDHYRAVILLRDVEERTVDEIAAALGLTREAVKARLHRGRILLREYLLH